MTGSRAVLALTALLAACTTPVPPPAAVRDLGVQKIEFTQSSDTVLEPVPNDWWRLYDDEQLDHLVLASLAANADLRVAYANLNASRAAVDMANAGRMPQTTIESGLGVDDPTGQPSAFSVPATDWDAGLAISWDLDLFGRLRSSALAASAQLAVQQAALEGVRVAVVADTVGAYVELCAATQAVDTANQVVQRQDRFVALLRAQRNAGEISPLEVAQAESQAAVLRAAIAPFSELQASARYRLARLQADPSVATAMECQTLPRLQQGVPVGDGSALLMRRPDIREAERRLAAATAQLGVARADLYPRVNLGGALGLLGGDFSTVVSPFISWSFPNMGPARARIAAAAANERAILAGWEVVVLRALQEVTTAVASYDARKRQAQSLELAADAAERYATLAAARVRYGDAAVLLRIDAERAWAAARLSLVQSELSAAQAEVMLFRALGGGWQVAASSG